MERIEHFGEGLAEERGTSYNANRDFTTLKAWKNARKIKLFFYRRILPALPKKELYDLGSQIREAYVSITSNIAEGYGRFHFQEGIQFYRISRGSMYELKDHLITCIDLNYIQRELFDEGIPLIEAGKKTINGYINYVKKQKTKNK